MQPATHAAQPMLVIREMRRDDVPAVSALAARVWRKHYAPGIVTHEQIEYMIPRNCSEAAILGNMQEKKQRLFLAEDNGALTGYIAVEPRGDSLFIDKLYIDMARQRKGAGAALLTHIVSEFKPARLDLRVNRKNFTALNFYFKHGFAIEALDVLDIGSGYVMDDFLMKKIL